MATSYFFSFVIKGSDVIYSGILHVPSRNRLERAPRHYRKLPSSPGRRPTRAAANSHRTRSSSDKSFRSAGTGFSAYRFEGVPDGRNGVTVRVPGQGGVQTRIQQGNRFNGSRERGMIRADPGRTQFRPQPLQFRWTRTSGRIRFQDLTDSLPGNAAGRGRGIQADVRVRRNA